MSSRSFAVPVLPSIAVLAALVLPACQTSVRSTIGDHGILLAETKLPEGGSTTFRLYPGDEGQAKLSRIESRTLRRAFLNVSASDINADLAARLGVDSWQGVLVEKVGSGSAAARAGLARNDVLLALDGTALTNSSQFAELVAQRLSPDRPVTASVSRPTSAGRETLTVEFTPDSKDVTESKTDSFTLPASKGVQRLTGMQVVTVEPELAREIFASDEPVALVSGVVVGSPAYFAGVRGGDRLLEVDGAAAPRAEVLEDAVLARAQDLDLPRELIERPSVAEAPARMPEARGGPIPLRVVGPSGAHAASVDVVDDLEDESDFVFPILFSYHSSRKHLEWSFLDFIFQFGANYDSAYRPTTSRQPSHWSELSMLPLGMFEFESGPTGRRWQLFWFIEFKTRG